MSYFTKFPIIEYDGSLCVDITRRVAIRKTVSADPKVYRPYDVKAGQRSDQIADGYYGRSDREWMVYLSGTIIDPYYDWYLSDRDFAQYVLGKYGSLEESIERVHHWQINWAGIDSELSVGEWSALPDDLKTYYEPVFGKGAEIISYLRREEDITTTTNMLVTVELGENHGLEAGDRLRVLSQPGNVQVGQAEVCWSNTTHSKLVHVVSDTDPGLFVVKVEPGVSHTPVEILDREYTANNIPVDERVYWEPVSAFDWERDRNESRKSIRLVDSRLVNYVDTELERLLSE